MNRNMYQRNPREIYNGDCRFTERRLEVARHGHGIKVSIRHSENKGDVVSIFLDAGGTDDLVQSLATVSPGAPTRAQLAHDAAEDRAAQLTRVLHDLASVLQRSGF